MSLDYLVIGAQSSPARVYFTYGQEIEAVKQRQETVPDCHTQIIKEADFVSAVVSAVTARGGDL